jgi:hypothetical protein
VATHRVPHFHSTGSRPLWDPTVTMTDLVPSPDRPRGTSR